MKVSFRQGILRHQTDGANNPLFLQSSGSTVNLFVSPDPTIFTVTHGVAEYLYTESVTVNGAWQGPFSTGTDYWLYWDINRTSGLRTFGHTELEPIEQSTPPPSPLLGQHWFNTTARKMFEWQGSSWGERIRVFAAKYVSGTAFESMSINAPDFRGTQVGLTTPFNSGSIAFDSAGKPIRNSNGTFFTTEDLFTAGVPSGSSLKINTIIVNAEAQEPLAAFQVVMLTDYNEIEHANPYFQTTKVLGILEEDAPTGETVRMVTEGRLTYDQWDWEAAGADVNDYLYISLTGELQLVPAIADQLPIGQVIDRQTIIFRPAVLEADVSGDAPLDHNILDNLDSDDHPQYHNDTRGDTRYYPRTELDPILTGKADTVHTHVKADILDFAHTHFIADVSGLQIALDSKLNRSGDTMDTNADLTFDGGEVFGLPDIPTQQDAAASKEYVDNNIESYTAGTNITFTGSPNVIDVSPQGVGSGLDADLWDGQQSDITTPANGEVLTFDGTNWTNAAPAPSGISTVQEEGSPVAGSPHDTMNFVGSGVTATDGTGGVVTVTIPGGASVNVQDEGGALAGTPHSTLNFIGAGVVAANAGSGVASITIAGGGGGGGGSKIEDTDGDTWVDVEATADSDEVEIVLGDKVDGFTAGPVAEFNRTGTTIRALAGTTNDGGTVGVYGGDSARTVNGATGGGITIKSGDGTAYNPVGGNLTLSAGDNTDADGYNGGDVSITAGDSNGYHGGNIDILAGTNTGTGSNWDGGTITIQAGDGAGDYGGYLHLRAGNGQTSGQGGRAYLTGGTGVYYGGSVTVKGGDVDYLGYSIAADVNIYAGNCLQAQGGGGNVRIGGGGANNDRGDFEGGFVRIDGGSATSAGGYSAGPILFEAGVIDNQSNLAGASILLDGEDFNRNGGDVDISAGIGSTAGQSAGSVNIDGGSGVTNSAIPGDITLTAGSTRMAATPGGDVTIIGGDTDDTTNDPLSVGGNVVLIAGQGDNGGQAGGYVSLETRAGTAADGYIQIRSQDSLAPTLRFNDQDDSAYIGLKAPNAATTVTYTLPVSPVNGQVLTTDSSGVLSWTAAAAAVTTSSLNIQYIHTGASGTVFNVNHNLGQQWCTVQVYDSGTGVNITPTSITMVDANNCTVVLGSAAAVKIVVVGVTGVV